MPDQTESQYARQIAVIQQELTELQASRRIVTSPQELEELEREIRQLTDRLAAAILGQKVQVSLDSDEVQEAETNLIKNHPKRLKSEGKKSVTIRTVYGADLTLNVRYYRRHCDRRKKKRCAGLYAGLALLGIFERCTPALTSEISQMVVLLGSFAEAQQILSQQGHTLCEKTLRLIAYRAADRARLAQKTVGWLGHSQENVAGRRVVISSDGGRIRLREKKRGPKTAKKRNRYVGAWREPKLFIIYVVDETGKQDSSFAPLIDGALQDPDTLFAMLTHYLQALEIGSADQILFVSDGAKWIWNRLSRLVDTLQLDSQNVHFLIDFYHAVEHLNKAASLRKDWTAKVRNKWLNKQRKSLHQGGVEQVIEAIQKLCRGRNSKAIRTQLNYFINHRNHMHYALISGKQLPIGSGAIESAIRRVVNLRLKGPSLFWCKPNADAMLMLRAFCKSGRWSLFTSLTLSPSHAFAL
jgi:hypothetical protein